MKTRKTFDVTLDQYRQMLEADEHIMRWNLYYKEHFNEADICRKFDEFTESMPIDEDLFDRFYVYEGIYEEDFDLLNLFFNAFTVDGMDEDEVNQMIYVPSFITFAVRRWSLRIAE